MSTFVIISLNFYPSAPLSRLSPLFFDLFHTRLRLNDLRQSEVVLCDDLGQVSEC